MHSWQEREEALRTVLRTSQQITQQISLSRVGVAAWDYWQFCIRHGYWGMPIDSPEKFSVGNYLQLGRSGSPNTVEEARRSLGIIVCFSDEAHLMPGNPQPLPKDGLQAVETGYVSLADRILVIGYVDWLTPIELGLEFLHEARHARHRFGQAFENLRPLDLDEFHEGCTWKYDLDLLDVYGGRVWQDAVEQELAWVVDYYTMRNWAPGGKQFAMSGQYTAELDQLYGPARVPGAVVGRSMQVAMRANFRLAETWLHPSRLEEAYANIVGAYHDWARKK